MSIHIVLAGQGKFFLMLLHFDIYNSAVETNPEKGTTHNVSKHSTKT